ncbi:MAG: peptidoglycan DD-metalloendopeptidase family protein [Pyrinomonadaceae bacterium]
MSTAPEGGGEYKVAPKDEISDEQRRRIQAEIQTNIEGLKRAGRLDAVSPEVVSLSWPVRKASGSRDYDIDGISNYVDQNPAFPNQIRDWNCGTRTYDQSNGYNHKGIDIFTWPFSWLKMDNNEVEVVAAADGSIILKSDGNFDRSCSLGGGNWNAIYVRHSDGSVAWYGHMKNGSLPNKGVGDTVVTGEKLGIVGSSGNSTGPHLHFELYNSSNQLQDPFQGPCNTLNLFSWWAVQEPYRASRVNRLMTQSAGPSFPTCPATETTNEKTVFRPGQTIYTAAYYRDQTVGLQTQYSLIRPDGTLLNNWSHNSPNTYNASYWFWSWSLPSNSSAGTWKFRATFNSVSYEQTFTVDSNVTISGRVTTPTGIGLRNAVVTMTDSQNVRRTATTSSFGLYSFESVPIGESYIIGVSSKRYRFASRTVLANNNLSDIDFSGLE